MLASESDAEWFRDVVRTLTQESISRADVGRLLGLNASYVSKVARGERHAVRQATVEDVVRRLQHRRPVVGEIAGELLARRHPVARFAEAGEHFKHAAEVTHPAAPHAKWALSLYRECQRDAEGDPWFEPGGAERRFIARLREYAGGGE